MNDDLKELFDTLGKPHQVSVVEKLSACCSVSTLKKIDTIFESNSDEFVLYRCCVCQHYWLYHKHEDNWMDNFRFGWDEYQEWYIGIYEADLPKQQKIKQEAEAKKQEAKDAQAQKRREEQESINKLYNLPKNIGDKVCNKMETCGLFGCDSYEVSAFVEGKSGDRIQIRIADPKVMRSYQGVDIYKGSILWDQYNNWKPCN